MSQKIEGTFKAVANPQQYGSEGKTLTKFYIDIDLQSQYPGVAEFQFFGDKINVSTFKQGEPIEVHYNISGRKAEWEKDGQKKSGFFQSLIAWKVERPQHNTTAHEPAPVQMGDDDLPF